MEGAMGTMGDVGAMGDVARPMFMFAEPERVVWLFSQGETKERYSTVRACGYPSLSLILIPHPSPPSSPSFIFRRRHLCTAANHHHQHAEARRHSRPSGPPGGRPPNAVSS